MELVHGAPKRMIEMAVNVGRRDLVGTGVPMPTQEVAKLAVVILEQSRIRVSTGSYSPLAGFVVVYVAEDLTCPEMGMSRRLKP